MLLAAVGALPETSEAFCVLLATPVSHSSPRPRLLPRGRSVVNGMAHNDRRGRRRPCQESLAAPRREAGAAGGLVTATSGN